MKIIITTCDGREEYVQSLIESIPNAIVNKDDFKDAGPYVSTAFYNFQRTMKMAGNSDLLYLEDDIILCDNFLQRIEKAKSEYPNEVIQFFSMRNKDLTIGTRREPGSSYMMMQCTYFPMGVARGIYEHSMTYYEEKHKIAPNDPCVADYLRKNKISYIIYVPNLVDHIIGTSKVSSRRSSKRISKTFKK